jgi:hypothetical protein
MGRTQGQLAPGGSFVDPRAGDGASGWLGRRRGLVIAVAATSAIVALALSQDWLVVADLRPLLFVLPCAVMMLMCMKGMGNGQQADSASTTPQIDAPTVTDTRN